MKQELRLVVSARAIKELGLVYRNPLDVIRELIQNAIDAKATSIHILYDGNGKQLIFEHNGEPIEGEYLDAFLIVGTDFKAKSGQYHGFFGIGRLSWLLIGYKAEIITGWNKLIWTEEKLDAIGVESLQSYFNGVRWIIHLRDDVKLSVEEVREYVEQNYHGDVPVYVNGAKVKRLLDDAELIYRDGYNEVYLVRGSSTTAGLIVRGVFTVERDYRFSRLIVRTSDPRVKMNPARGLIWDDDYEEWRSDIARRVLEALHQRYSPSELYRDVYMLADLAEIAFPISIIDEKGTEDAYRNRVKYLVFKTVDGGYVRGFDVDPEHYVYAILDVTDTTIQKLRKRGIKVIYAHPSKVEDWLKNAGFRRVDEVAVEDEARCIVSKDLEEKLCEVYREIRNVIGEVAPYKRYRSTASVSIGGAQYSAFIREGADVVEIRYVSAEQPGKVHAVQAKIVGRLDDIDVVLVSHSDEDTVAFTDGSKIYVNVNNPRIKELISRTKKMKSKWKLLLLWSPVLVHEMIHMYGYDHTDPEWHQLYETAIMKIHERVLENLK